MYNWIPTPPQTTSSLRYWPVCPIPTTPQIWSLIELKKWDWVSLPSQSEPPQIMGGISSVEYRYCCHHGLQNTNYVRPRSSKTKKKCVCAGGHYLTTAAWARSRSSSSRGTVVTLRIRIGLSTDRATSDDNGSGMGNCPTDSQLLRVCSPRIERNLNKCTIKFNNLWSEKLTKVFFVCKTVWTYSSFCTGGDETVLDLRGETMKMLFLSIRWTIWVNVGKSVWNVEP